MSNLPIIKPQRSGLFSYESLMDTVFFDEMCSSVIGHEKLYLSAFFDLCHSEDIDAFRSTFNELINNKIRMNYKVRMKRDDDYISLICTADYTGPCIIGVLEIVSEDDFVLSSYIENMRESESKIAQIEEDNALYTSVLEKTPIGFIITKDDRVCYSTPTAQSLLGIAEHDSFTCCFEDISEYDTLIEKLRTRNILSWYPVLLHDKNGEKISVTINVQSDYYKGHKALMIWLVGSDDVSISTYELKLANEITERNAMAKNEYISEMGHEIRTPMNAISGFTDLIKSTELSEKQQSYIRRIEQASESLFITINKIIDFSKTEIGKLEISKVPFLLSDILMDLQIFLSVEAGKKELSYKIDCDFDIDIELFGNPIRLHQILLSIITNALQFTHRGGISVKITKNEQTDSFVIYQFEVADTGIGMSKKQVDMLLEPLSATDVMETRKYGGTGLSLMISKNLIELMDGTLWCRSKVDVGSTFFFTAKFELAKNHVKKDPIFTQLDSEFDTYDDNDHEKNTQLKILVVEDVELNRIVLDEILKNKGYAPQFACNGEEGVQMVLGGAFDIVFMDIRMPVMNGFEATREIRKHEKHKDLPIIAMTAHATQKDREDSFKAGMNSHVTKPIEAQLIYKVIRHWVKKV